MDKKTRVLVLDDEPIVGERLKASLENAGFSVDTFSSSRAALESLRNEPYDMLVTDLKMSGPDGLDVLREARQSNPAIKAVVITGFATTQTAQEALSSGAVSFLAKPFKMSKLKEILLELAPNKGASDGE